jgi:hypothetical protein
MYTTRKSARLNGPESVSINHDSMSSAATSIPEHSFQGSRQSSRRSSAAGIVNDNVGMPHSLQQSSTLIDKDGVHSPGLPTENHSDVPAPRRSTRPLKKRPAELAIIAAEHLMNPATTDDRRNWKGWCEIESEPVSKLVLSPRRHCGTACPGLLILRLGLLQCHTP